MIILLQRLANLLDNPQSRGTFGEMIVSSIFDSRFFGDEEHYIVNNLIFETEDKKTHQIDHVVIYKTGIFCIETKNIAGKIIGHDSLHEWKVYNSAETYEILNPIIQNKTHMIVLSEFLEYRYDVQSAIVFIKGNKPKGCSKEVLNLQELKDYVKNFTCKNKLTSEEMKGIYSSLTDYKEESNITNRDHLNNVRGNKK